MLDRHGILHLSGEDTIGPGLSEAAFLRSPLGQASESNGSNDGWSRYRVQGTLDNGLTCSAGLFFFNGYLRRLSFRPHWPGSARSWREWSEEGELRVNDQNNELLAEHFGPPPYTFTWGHIESSYNPKSGSSSIFVQYDAKNAKLRKLLRLGVFASLREIFFNSPAASGYNPGAPQSAHRYRQ